MVSAETDDLPQMLTRLKLTATRDQLDALLDEAARRQMSLRETVVFLCEAEVARKDERRVHMAQSLAKFPYRRTLDDFEFDASRRSIRDRSAIWQRAAGSPTAMRCWFRGRRGLAKRIWPWGLAAKRSGAVTRYCSSRRPHW